MVVQDRDSVVSENSKGKKDIFLLGKNISKWKINSKFYANYSELEIIGGTKKLWIDAVKYTDGFGDTIAGDPNLLIDAVLELHYRVPPTAAMRTYLKTTILLGGQASDHYWTDAWLAYKAAPTNAAALNIVTTRLQAFYKFLIQNPEYQLS